MPGHARLATRRLALRCCPLLHHFPKHARLVLCASDISKELQQAALKHADAPSLAACGHLDSSAAGWGGNSWEGLSTGTALRWRPARRAPGLASASEICRPASSYVIRLHIFKKTNSNKKYASETFNSTQFIFDINKPLLQS